MATTLPHIRLTASGTLGKTSANEIWSCSMKLLYFEGGTGPSGMAPGQDAIDIVSAGAAGIWASYISSTVPAAAEGATFSDLVAVTAVKAAGVLASGLDNPALHSTITDVTANNRGVGLSGPTATTPIYSVPYTNSLVVTMLGAQYIRGAAAYGRFYLPCPNLYFSSADGISTKMVDGLIDPTVATQHALAASTKLLQPINQLLANTAQARVQVANISTSAAAAGVRSQPVNHIRVDTRPDTVRRRSNKISGRGFGTHAV